MCTNFFTVIHKTESQNGLFVFFTIWKSASFTASFVNSVLFFSIQVYVAFPTGESASASIRNDPLVQVFRASAGRILGQEKAMDENRSTSDSFHIHERSW